MRHLLKLMLIPVAVLSVQAHAAGQAGARPADNTAVNARDKDGAMATPQNQSNAEADRKLLAEIRRTVVKDKSLSTSAHNVKILVTNGAVLLRGPVKTDDEKARVETAVKQVAGIASVDNQLEVKAH